MNSQISDTLERTASHPRRRILLTGGAVVSMDPAVPDLPAGDVLVEGNKIVGIGPDLRAAGADRDAIVIDTSGSIVAPGFVDTHRHAWQTQLRRSMPAVNDLGEYVMSALAVAAPAYSPQDMYVGTRLAALTAIDSGITCMLDFSHNSRTAEHSDQAINALLDTGIRAVHASMSPHFGEWDEQWPADLHRLKQQYFASTDQLLTLRLVALATDEIAGPRLAYGPELAAVAGDLDLGVSVDAVFGQSSSRAVLDWKRQGLLSPRLTLIHCTGLTAEAWRAMGGAGATVALAPTFDAQIGLETAIPAVDESLAVGIRPGLSIDVEIALAGDMFTQMRTLLSIQRMLAVNAAYGTDADPSKIAVRDVLDFATLQGARTNGLEDVTGSLSPGKQADIIVVRADDVNNMPLNDAVGTLVLGADARNIETVLVADQPRKIDGRLVDVDLDRLRDDVLRSRDEVAERSARSA